MSLLDTASPTFPTNSPFPLNSFAGCVAANTALKTAQPAIPAQCNGTKFPSKAFREFTVRSSNLYTLFQYSLHLSTSSLTFSRTGTAFPVPKNALFRSFLSLCEVGFSSLLRRQLVNPFVASLTIPMNDSIPTPMVSLSKLTEPHERSNSVASPSASRRARTLKPRNASTQVEPTTVSSSCWSRKKKYPFLFRMFLPQWSQRMFASQTSSSSLMSSECNVLCHLSSIFLYSPTNL